MTTVRLTLDRAREHLERAVDDQHQTRAPFVRADIEELTAIIAGYQRAVASTQLDALPVLGRRLRSIGCEVEVAFALNTVADILLAQGKLDEALRIRTREQLPRLVAHGHTLEHANALGKIADILLIQGKVEESLAIRIDEPPHSAI